MERRAPRVRHPAAVIAASRAALATAVMYLLCYPFTAIMLGILDLLLLAGLGRAVPAGCVLWARALFLLAGRPLHVYGLDGLDGRRPYLLVANHSSMYDIPALMAAFPGLALVGREHLMQIPLLGYFLRATRFIPIDTGSIRGAGAAIEAAVARGREGCTVAMFPEGTRTLTGSVQRLKRGFVRVLRESGLDLLPVRIDGTFRLAPKGRRYLDPAERITVSARRPLANHDLVRLSDEEIITRAGDELGWRGDDRP
jgi:1-acyl-sn-glycerol-3-phosphate acyltransferase